MSGDLVDERWMQRAIRVARSGWGHTHPNPVVGAVLVANDTVLAEGFHRVAGGPHAEVEALNRWGKSAPADAVLYVTLEPCSSTGKTGACTDAIIRAGVKRVVVGALDNDPRHRGRGLEILRDAGISIRAGILEDECLDLNLIFHFRCREGRPLIAAKMASTIDGKTAAESGASKWITGERSREDVHQWRRYFPAIAVGARTVLADDPELTARLGSEVYCPIRIVFDRSGRLAETIDRRIFTDRFRDQTYVFVAESNFEKTRSALPDEVGVVVCPEQGGVGEFLRDWLSDRKLYGVYVEGGSSLHGLLFKEEAVDYLFSYRAPKLFLDDDARPIASGRKVSSPTEAIFLEPCRHEFFDQDQLVRGWVRYP